MILGAGFSGIVAIGKDGVYQKKIKGKSRDGEPLVGIFLNYKKHVVRGIPVVVPDRDKHFFIGLTTVVNYNYFVSTLNQFVFGFIVL